MPRLLSGGHPQIAKGDGDAAVQAYIAAMPGWKQDVGRRLDALILRAVPNVRKAARWNTPIYGVEGQGWILVHENEELDDDLIVSWVRHASELPGGPLFWRWKWVRCDDAGVG